MTGKLPPRAHAGASKKTGGSNRPFWNSELTKLGETNDESNAVRCESTALYRVCQARTTTSSSLNAYPPTQGRKPDKRLWRTAGTPDSCGFALRTSLDGR